MVNAIRRCEGASGQASAAPPAPRAPCTTINMFRGKRLSAFSKSFYYTQSCCRQQYRQPRCRFDPNCRLPQNSPNSVLGSDCASARRVSFFHPWDVPELQFVPQTVSKPACSARLLSSVFVEHVLRDWAGRSSKNRRCRKRAITLVATGTNATSASTSLATTRSFAFLPL